MTHSNQSRPRLLLVGNFLSVKGATPTIIEYLANKLTVAGYEIIATSSYRNGWLRGIDMILTAIFKCHQYEAVIIDLYSGRAFLWGEVLSIILKILHRPFVLALHGGALPQFSKRHPRRVTACLKRASAVVTPSPYLLETMKSYAPEIQQFPNPLDLSHYSFIQRTTPQPRLIWLRSFHQIYHPILAVEVLSILVPRFPDMKLMMIGPDKGDGSLQAVQAKAKELNISEHIEVVGKVPKEEVPEWLNRGDIFINTTNVDNTPVSVLEAMACGLWVVSTNVGGIPYLLEHETDALLVPPKDPKAMAMAIQRLLNEPELAKMFSGNARKKVDQFDWSVLLPKWERLLKEITENGSI